VQSLSPTISELSSFTASALAGSASSLAAGLLWIATGLLYLSGPAYSQPRTILDYAAIAFFSGAMLVTAVALLTLSSAAQFRLAWVGSVPAVVGAAGGAIAGLADIGEDWLGIAALASWFFLGWLLLAAGSIGLAIALLIAGGAWRAAAIVPFAMVIGFTAPQVVSGPGPVGADDQGRGLFVVGIAWLALGLVSFRRGSHGP
jgi:hypothetical protein